MKSILSKIQGIYEILSFDNRWEILFNRLLFPKTGLIVYRRKNVEVLIDHLAGDVNGMRMCLVSDMYYRYVKKMNLPSKLSVFDIGANSGGFPLMLKLNNFEIENLTCVEMNPNTFARLQLNIQKN